MALVLHPKYSSKFCCLRRLLASPSGLSRLWLHS